MKEKNKVILILTAAVVILAGALVLYNNLKDKTPKPGITISEESSEISEATESQSNETSPQKMKAPDFTVKDKEGNDVKLSDFVGKPVVVNFWASWCSFCKIEMPDFQEVYDENKDDVVFLMINATDGMRETTEKAKEFYDEKGYTMPVYFDVDSEAGSAFSVTSLPTTYFIDSEGYLVTGAAGALSKDTLLEGIGYIKE